MTMKVSDEWLTAPTASESGAMVIVTVRTEIDELRLSGKYNSRVEVTWRYAGDEKGMPSVADSNMMEQATDALNAAFNADPVAVMTGIYTGENERNWVFYTRSLHIFRRKFNEALAALPAMPLEFDVDDDPQWQHYLDVIGN